MKETVAILINSRPSQLQTQPKKQVRFADVQTNTKKIKLYETECHLEKKQDTVLDMILYKILEKVLVL